MKRYSILAFIFLAVIGAFAQNISVADFQLRETDMTAASRDGRRIDQNGQPAALIRIETTETGFVFEAGALGIVDSKQETGEVWVWVPRASRKITIKHPKLGVLYDYRYPVEIEAERTYWMKLTTATIETIVKEQVRQQYLAFKITPPNAILEVNDQLWSVDADGTAMQYVEFGTYSYRVRAANYHPDAGLVTVEDPDNTKLVTVNLKPNLAEVTLKVDADAEIWVNNEKKGVRTWTGGLGKGVYRIECRQAGHETTLVSKEITSEMNGQTIMLTAPRPIYGSLMVESTPNFAKLYVDGRDMGNTPKSINEILVGQHEIRLTYDGYVDHTETVTIAKGEKKKVRTELTVSTTQSDVNEGIVTDQNRVSVGETAPAQTVTQRQHPKPKSWEEVVVSRSMDDAKGMVFKGEITKASGWGGAAGAALGYNNAVKMIQKEAVKKGCNLIVVTAVDYGMTTRVTARLYSFD